MLEDTYTSLLILVCVAVLAFTVLVVKKLYQGQR
ncbi:membrane protein [Streptomyces sp. AcH 505]|nr:membrane protein [Streptomyces sp. AcH 505]